MGLNNEHKFPADLRRHRAMISMEVRFYHVLLIYAVEKLISQRLSFDNSDPAFWYCVSIKSAAAETFEPPTQFTHCFRFGTCSITTESRLLHNRNGDYNSGYAICYI